MKFKDLITKVNIDKVEHFNEVVHTYLFEGEDENIDTIYETLGKDKFNSISTVEYLEIPF